MEDNALLCHGLQQSNAEQRKALQAQFSQVLSDKILDNPSAKQFLLQSLSCLGGDMTKVQSFAKYLLALSESDRTKALHRLLVELNVPLAEIVQSLQSELSQRRSNSVYYKHGPKLIFEIARYVTDPADVQLLSSVASSYDSWVASEIEQQVNANLNWVEQNVEPLKNALTRYFDA